MITCTKCGLEKQDNEFAFDSKRKTGKTCWCKECKRTSATDYYWRNRDKILKRERESYAKDSNPKILIQKRARERYREEWLKHLPNEGKVSCSRCGYDKCFAAIDFHHIRDKKYTISALMSHKPTDERIELLKKEIEKCIILCANCHREHHVNEPTTEFNR